MKFLWAQWSKSKKGNSSRLERLLHQRRNVLFSRFTLIGLLVTLAHTAQDVIQRHVEGASLDAFFALVILSAYLLNKAGKHTAGKILALAFVNVGLALYCSIVPKHNGVFLFYFPLVGLSYVVFDYQQRLIGLFFVGLSAVFLAGLIITDFKLLGDVSIPASPERSSFLISLTSSSLILSLCINFMMKYNNEAERHLMKLAEEIREKNIHLEKTNSELDRFVYSASHDLRAPLLSILGIVNISRYENPSPKVADYLTLIDSQVLKLDRFIKDIINYSHNARTEVVEQPVDFDHVLEGVRENLSFMEGAEKIKWEKEIDGEFEWRTDKYRIGTVLNNLLSNAIKYHNYSRDDRWIKIVVRKDCSACCITIRDNGVGIPPEHHNKVFDMFYRAHDHSNGSGLGLYIVKEIVAKMNGTIQLQSQPGHGSTFTITLPVLAA
jgi:signal transduction histidine kinase